MRQLFVPYHGSQPARLEIKGHSFIILARTKKLLESHLDNFGADHLRGVAYRDRVEESQSLDQLARTIKGAVVIAPANVIIEDLVNRISNELPWLH